MLEFNQPFDPANSLPPAEIREAFGDLCFSQGCDPQELLDKLSAYLPTDTLRSFLDDLAMGRV